MAKAAKEKTPKADKKGKKPAKDKAPAKKKAAPANGATGGKSVIDRAKYQYAKSDVKTASGKRKCVDNGDSLAEALRGIDVAGLTSLAKKNGVWKDEYEARNPGMIRMIVGNRLRAIAAKGDVAGI